ncbi:DUF421 domain-containing protein [Azotobacter salinestris]|uniref:DUF421 domain-containing protein n=1 Tax=Azotobacter salinestris TaxID=69964 RepID=UPI00142EBFCD|nr:YetF domain-containing protein [Azotobacter salinestris]
MERMFFEDWFGLLRILIVGVLAYIALVCLLRLSGKRTLSKMNAFDLVVTVALGSTLATVLLNRSIALAEGALAFALLTGLQFAITWSSVRARWVRRIVKAEPQLLLHDGQFLKGALRRTRVTEEEILAAVRGAGMSGLEDVRAVVLETDGSFSVIRQGKQAGISTLANVVQPSEDGAV